MVNTESVIEFCNISNLYNQEISIRNWMKLEIELRTFKTAHDLAVACACGLHKKEWLDNPNHSVYVIAWEFIAC